MFTKYNFSKILNHPIASDLSEYKVLLKKINQHHKTLIGASAAELKNKGNRLHNLVQGGAILDEILPEAFALVKEVCYLQTGLLAYDVQLIAGIAMHQGKLIEMQTGEGKTLAAIFPAYLQALTDKGVQILTFNDYLAQRDANWSRPIFEFLSVSVGAIQQGQSLEKKRMAYRCGITYATAKELGFDYLRDFTAYDTEALLLPPFHFAIIDEADAILIDEARNPLVLAGDLLETDLDLHQIADFVDSLAEHVDFQTDDLAKNVFLTDAGIDKVEAFFDLENIHSSKNYPLLSPLNLAMHASIFLIKEVDYIVKKGEIKLIDAFTGRIVEDRKWRNGLQSAVEAKEGLVVQSEGTVLNSLTLQHLLQKFPKLAGMTATARQAAEEFKTTYQLSTVIIPPNIPSQRKDLEDVVFVHKTEKTAAIIAEIERVHRRGQPILIGTLTVKESEDLAERIWQIGIPCQVLNAKNDEEEARIIAKAGCSKAVTISTNMAGRGTDIVLGGGDPLDRQQVVALGGLYVLGTNYHESIRIDRQLRGRAGRQGDPGSTRFYVSFEDELMVRHRLRKVLPKKFRKYSKLGPVTNPRIVKFLPITQHIIDCEMFDQRQYLCRYASFLEKQRSIIQGERQNWLDRSKFLSLLQEQVGARDIRVTASWKPLQAVILYQYDLLWAKHLQRVAEVKQGIHLVRLGGRNPLHEFGLAVDRSFTQLCEALDAAVTEKIEAFLAHPEKAAAHFFIQRPSSTWTYVISDNNFSNQLSMLLSGNGNIGMQVDLFTAPLLFLKGVYDWMKNRSGTGAG